MKFKVAIFLLGFFSICSIYTMELDKKQEISKNEIPSLANLALKEALGSFIDKEIQIQDPTEITVEKIANRLKEFFQDKKFTITKETHFSLFNESLAQIIVAHGIFNRDVSIFKIIALYKDAENNGIRTEDSFSRKEMKRYRLCTRMRSKRDSEEDEKLISEIKQLLNDY